MKTRYSIVIAFLCLLQLLTYQSATAQNVAINTTGSAPDASAMLDVQSTNKGILIPQVSLSLLKGNSTSTGITNPAASLLVYNTNTAVDGGAGYYYNAGTTSAPIWVKMVASDTATVVEDDLRVTIDKGTNAAQLGSLTGITGPEIWFFRDGQGLEAMSFTIQLPHNWKEGTNIHPHIHWVPKTTASGNMKWNLDYSWVNLDLGSPLVFPAVTTSSVVVTGGFTMNQHLLSPLTAGDVGIDGTGKTFSSILVCRIWRNSTDAADTYAGDAGGLSMDFHIDIKNVFR